ncbi:enoyl-CoA hydratase/isomerase family protein [Endozoicomonas sp. G2_1]|uniref:enoyl-CoA hydratase-related protein n=1 Tax=Endozoicomonas sp. G2_1 TaxID=2821091 RepID=UPI001AD9D396|nr:enoyl-CoA hydratase/isomerase family protein [Endozoicomonas sp. G2_1]
MVEDQIIEVRFDKNITEVLLNNTKQRNCINSQFIERLNEELTIAEQNPACRVMSISAKGDTFCIGMDFSIVHQISNMSEEEIKKQGKQFYELLSRLCQSRLIIVATVNGIVSAGGVGLISACDFVIAGTNSKFSLPEALWDLVPYCIAPFIVKRMGLQNAKTLALSTQQISAKEAYTKQLVDEVVDNPNFATRKLTNRISRLQINSLHKIKSLFNSFNESYITRESEIIDQYTTVMSKETVLNNITRFIQEGKFSWET